jgi:hypothetical protein
MATVLAQILDRVDAILKAQVPAGTNVFRDRADAQSLAEAPSINVVPRDGQTEPFSAEMDLHQIHIELRIYVRAEPGTPSAEAIHEAVHRPMVTDQQLADLCESRRLTESSFDLTEADTTSLIKAVRYRLTYLIPSTSL